jgi:hypothetical protein
MLQAPPVQGLSPGQLPAPMHIHRKLMHAQAVVPLL